MIVVCGPTMQSRPICVLPFRDVPGSMIVSWPIAHVGVDVRAVGVQDAHAFALERVVDAALRQLADLAELDAVVDAERERRVRDQVGLDRLDLRQHVREVQLALRVVGPELVERVEQRLAVERVDPGVDLADLELLGRRVPLAALGLDDLLDVAGLVADHAAVLTGIVELHRGHRRLGLGVLVRLHERGERLGGDQRHVAREDHDRRVGVDVGRGRLHRAARAVGLRLDRDLDALGQPILEPALRIVDHDDLPGPGLLRPRIPATESAGDRTAGAEPWAARNACAFPRRQR